MSRVILVRLPYESIYTVYGKLPKNHELRPPLGLMYIASSLETAGHDVSILDCAALGLNLDRTARKIMAASPHFVGITATTPEFYEACKLARLIKGHDDEIKVVLGGAHVSALPEESLCYSTAIDYVVVGEGELSMRSIVEGKPTNRVVQRPDVEDLDSLPAPARHLVNYHHYKYPMPGRGLVKTDVVQSIRGCPYGCTFCANANTKPRLRDPRAVVQEIKKSRMDNGVGFVMFLDDTLTFDRAHIVGICSEILREGLDKKLGFWGLVRADTVDKGLLILMADAGFKELSMGVESGSGALTSSARKGISRERYREAYRWMTELGIQARGSFIMGLPGETHRSARETIRFAKELDLVRASCNLMTPYPGTKLYEQADGDHGFRLLTRDWSKFRRWGNSVIETDGLSKRDLEGYQKDFLTKFYSQPKVILYHLKQFLRGNRSLYFHRPLLFALKQRFAS